MKAKLRFFGQNYSPSNDKVVTIPSDIRICYRGQSYLLRRPLQSFTPQFVIRKYRGILYFKHN